MEGGARFAGRARKRDLSVLDGTGRLLVVDLPTESDMTREELEVRGRLKALGVLSWIKQ